MLYASDVFSRRFGDDEGGESGAESEGLSESDEDFSDAEDLWRGGDGGEVAEGRGADGRG